MRNRFYVVKLTIFLLSAIAAARLFSIQILSHKEYSARADDQYASYISIPARRGEILSSDGYPLASNQVSYLLYAEPKIIRDKQILIDKDPPQRHIFESVSLRKFFDFKIIEDKYFQRRYGIGG